MAEPTIQAEATPAADKDDRRRIRLVWVVGAALVSACFLNEALAGFGGLAWDFWAFFYVTLRGWLLPLLAVPYFAWVCASLIRVRSRAARARVVPAMLLGPALIAACWICQSPLFPR